MNRAFLSSGSSGRDEAISSNWVINELFGRLKKDDLDLTRSPVSPAQLGEIIDLIKDGDINGKIAKELFEIVYIDGGQK
jgi:aspartyl-tRNA(Asn)/glutamyl-tRNA(Gln) amidotransferase subunit B